MFALWCLECQQDPTKLPGFVLCICLLCISAHSLQFLGASSSKQQFEGLPPHWFIVLTLGKSAAMGNEVACLGSQHGPVRI